MPWRGRTSLVAVVDEFDWLEISKPVMLVAMLLLVELLLPAIREVSSPDPCGAVVVVVAAGTESDRRRLRVVEWSASLLTGGVGSESEVEAVLVSLCGLSVLVWFVLELLLLLFDGREEVESSRLMVDS